jgi:hypothetical protein
MVDQTGKQRYGHDQTKNGCTDTAQGKIPNGTPGYTDMPLFISFSVFSIFSYIKAKKISNQSISTSESLFRLILIC